MYWLLILSNQILSQCPASSTPQSRPMPHKSVQSVANVTNPGSKEPPGAMQWDHEDY